MTRVLLINANRLTQPWPVMPFGLGCVAGACEEAGHEVQVLDLCFRRDCPDDVRRAVAAFQPDVVGVGIRNLDNGVGSSSDFFLDGVRDDVIRPLRSVFAGPIVIGGAAVGVNAREMLGFFDLAYAVRGDGEAVMPDLLARHQARAPWRNVPGLVVREQGEIVEDSPPRHVADLDGLSRPSLHRYVDVEAYAQFNSPLQIQTKRGCPLHCTYCVYNQIEGSTYRLRSPQRVADEIEHMVADTGTNHIEFTDSTFNIPLPHAKAVLRAVAAKELDLRLRTMGLNPASFDDELVDLMQVAGFVDVDLGAESGCDVTLQTLGKRYTKQDVLRAGALLRARRITTTWFVLLGAPGETRATVEETLDTLTRAADPTDMICVSIGVRVYRGTAIARRVREENPAAGADGFLRPYTYQPPGIRLDEIRYLVRRAAFSHPNLIVAPDDERVTLATQRRSARLLQLLGSKQPIWKPYLRARRLEQKLGIARLRRWWWERRQNVARR